MLLVKFVFNFVFSLFCHYKREKWFSLQNLLSALFKVQSQMCLKLKRCFFNERVMLCSYCSSYRNIFISAHLFLRTTSGEEQEMWFHHLSHLNLFMDVLWWRLSVSDVSGVTVCERLYMMDIRWDVRRERDVYCHLFPSITHKRKWWFNEEHNCFQYMTNGF